MNRMLPKLLLALAVGFLFGCGSSTGIPVIATGSEFKEVLAKVEKLSQPVFEKADKAEILTDADQKALRESLKLFQGLSAFNPEAPTLYFGIGKCQQLLGDYKDSLASFETAAKIMKPSKDPELITTLAETQYLSSISFERIKSYEEAKLVAESATSLVPKAANYWVALASAEMQLKELKQAKDHLKKALQLDPSHKRARYLTRMIEISQGG